MIISQTPLRISFVGGGTDISNYYHIQDGMVISSTINKYVYVIVKERFDDLIVLNYTKKEIIQNVKDIKHDLIREAMKVVGIINGIEITTLADIPSSGSGLGSSSSVTVGLLNALYNFIGKPVTAETLAKKSCEIEIEILKKPIGKQDQYIVAYGGLKKIVFHRDEGVTVSDVVMGANERMQLSSNILLHFTNITRNADDILKKQKENNKIEYLKQIADLVPDLENAFIQKNFDILGLLLKKNWQLKKQLAVGITRSKIDVMTDIAEKNGATGFKIAGAGGGGFLMSYVPQKMQELYRKAMMGYRELSFEFDPFGSKIIFNILNYNSKK